MAESAPCAPAPDDARGADRPPEPPEIPRRVELAPPQVALLALTLTVVALALSGALGDGRGTERVEGDGLALAVEYPARLRYGELGGLRIGVENATLRPLDTVRVAIDAAYLDGFSDVRLTPEPEAAWVVVLTDLRPGERRVIAGAVKGEGYGRRRGALTATTAGRAPVSVELATFLFP